MKTIITREQTSFYETNGYIVIEDFLDSQELNHWKRVVLDALNERKGQKMPGKMGKLSEDDGINKDAEYHSKVFEQSINLWQTSDEVKELILDPKIGEMAATLAGVDGIRIWHDQALFKKPWANPTSWHLDTPFWSFTDRAALSIWIALDDATLENGCLFFIPGSHKGTDFANPGIGKNMDSIFTIYPQFKTARTVAVPMKAGSCSFHNGLTIHGAHANMTSGSRRAMTCAYMPDGNVFNGVPNVLPQYYLEAIKIGDLLNNDEQNPLVFKRS